MVETVWANGYAFAGKGDTWVLFVYDADSSMDHDAVTRKDLKGYPSEGYYPEECMDVETAVDCFTLGSAYQQFMEDRKGRLKLGYFADLCVLSEDIFTVDPDQIKDIVSVLMMVDGKIRYEA